MARYRLEALAPRRYCIGRNPDGSKRFATFTAEDVKAHAGKLTRMLAAAVPIPVCWEHRDDADVKRKLSRDDWASEQARGTAGWLETVELDAASNKLFAEVEIPDAADGTKAEALRFCSPEFRPDVIDGDANEWGRAIVHLALTPKPINQHQVPIQRLSAGAAGVALTLLADTVRLSVNPTRGDDMAETTVETPPAPLKPAGSDDVTNKTLLDFMQTMMTKMLDVMSGKKPEAEVDDDDEELDGEVAAVAHGGAVSMSQQKATERAVTLDRASLVKRADRLLKSKRITPAIHAKLKKDLETVKLAYDANGDLKTNAALARIEAYEELAKGSAWSERQDDTARMSGNDRHPAKRPPHATLETADAPDESPAAREGRMKNWEALNGKH